MKAQPLTVYLPDTRGVYVSSYGRGNRKIGAGVYTYSRPAGREGGTCPGSTDECEAICYAKRITGPVRDIYERNVGAIVPPIPADAKLLRIHVSGDFDSIEYIDNWFVALLYRPEVTAWAYTRSWRVPHLLPWLENLRKLRNMQLFASLDPSCSDMPPTGWRRAWIHRDFDQAIASGRPQEERLMGFDLLGGNHNQVCITDGVPSYVCPEETGRKPDCESCRYCFHGKHNDVTFLEH